MGLAEAGSLVALDASYCRSLVPRRDPAGHKFDFGRVVTIAGSLEYAGAAYLAALGAARAGAGLVTMAVPLKLLPVLAARLPEAVLAGLPETAAGNVDAAAALEVITARQPDALVVGPGLMESDDFRELVRILLAESGPPVVVDAGALNMLAVEPDWWKRSGRNLVLTPHAGEFSRLMGVSAGQTDDDRLGSASEASHKLGQVVVLKGARTVITDPSGRKSMSPFANAALATAGSGDVLAGVIGALLAQGMSEFDAACLGVYLHGRAGERLSWRYGDAGALASEIAHEIPATRHELGQHSQ